MDHSTEARIDEELRACLARAIRLSGKSRSQICDELSQLVGREIHVDTLNRWTARSKSSWRIPADAVPSLCRVLQDDCLQRLLLSDDQLGQLELGESVAKWLGKHFDGKLSIARKSR